MHLRLGEGCGRLRRLLERRFGCVVVVRLLMHREADPVAVGYCLGYRLPLYLWCAGRLGRRSEVEDEEEDEAT